MREHSLFFMPTFPATQTALKNLAQNPPPLFFAHLGPGNRDFAGGWGGRGGCGRVTRGRGGFPGVGGAGRVSAANWEMFFLRGEGAKFFGAETSTKLGS